MNKFTFVFFSLLISVAIHAQIEENYRYPHNKTYTYDETYEVYRFLAKRYDKAQLFPMGQSDVGKPIHLFVISESMNFDPEFIKESNMGVLLINNAIHPGEPCGVDASIKFANDLLKTDKYANLLKNTVVCIIPFYNVGGGLNRSCCSRANQNGPEEYGFRGNIKNRDLNRDFIKCDTKNAEIFTNIYHICKPDVFIDTHTTNGADFQYTMSLIATQPDKLNRYMRNHLRNKMLPYLYEDMKVKEKEIIPYVYNYKKKVDDGIKDYLDTPRYSTGYSTLFNSIGFVTEALKYKPYQSRVEHTYEFLMSTLKYMHEHHDALKTERKKAIEDVKNQQEFELGWYLDTTSFDQIEFKGYEAEYKESEFGENAKILVYNHNKPYTKKINYYSRYASTYVVNKPFAYIIPQAYRDVLDRLKWNQIQMDVLPNDTTLDVEMYYIKDYKTVKNPYEGHYLHYGVSLKKETVPVKFYKGDYLIKVNQEGNRYIVETLEPQGMDSFFAWNFFDGILQQKEWFSPFSFEATAKELLATDIKLLKEFNQKKKEDSDFAKSRDKQLYFIYKHSAHYENTHNRYPIARLLN